MLSFLDGATAAILPGGSGSTVAPQNVDFKFVPRRNGDRNQILAHNQKVYDQVLAQEIHEPRDFDMDSIRPPQDPRDYSRENATIIALVRNNEVAGIKRTLRQFESNFNAKFQYPYTFLNDEPFTESFKERVRALTKADVQFVHIPPEVWNKPASIDLARERQAMDQMEKENVAYAKKGSYHNMCRFYSGLFHDLPELQKYKYYWRIEPNVRFYTDLNYDVFKYLAGTKKIYGFTISLYDIRQSVRTLLPETLRFLNQGDNYKYVDPNGAFQWITENQQNPHVTEATNGYSTCHFWSNFEIADMDFYRGDAYRNWFNHLEATGNFYYERWGDAPVHSLGLALFADKRKLHWFRDIGYYHMPYTNCPNNENTKGCTTGKFDDSGHNLDQNCMATWIEYEMESLGAIY
ncbi:glycosyl transferase [Metschnikowia bicuspidata var. bicuspidata NRRL YB-4993]|uniref:Glycosyl transferase n=1 Tax=Metschnikowia bicuspidata var. bicuspidata NRRL YB-4993 TaxID=869754 RepID=A0A1A0H200_9ASCO|nr:glycosyl transferase [Metschnikowia bicuspidata var. bicuspidata NRRL YB-4993]OBA17980.1 glycosyl transferase [Metschnikowia bicuspidata var. bicuspidata NRRL YB-4993]